MNCADYLDARPHGSVCERCNRIVFACVTQLAANNVADNVRFLLRVNKTGTGSLPFRLLFCFFSPVRSYCAILSGHPVALSSGGAARSHTRWLQYRQRTVRHAASGLICNYRIAVYRQPNGSTNCALNIE